MVSNSTSDSNSILDLIAQSIYDKKGFNILALDVRKISTMTDYFIIAEGNVDRHVRAIGREIAEKLSEHRLTPLHTEGEQSGDWIVLDFGDIIIHLFTPELREKFSLEKLWHEGKIVNVKINTGALTE